MIANFLLGALFFENFTQIIAGRSTMEVEQIAELSDLINFGYYVDDNEDVLLWVDSRIFNKWRNTYQSGFDTFWGAMVSVVYMDGSSPQVFRKIKGINHETTMNIS